jgi:GNAT superfamily N-acetyltransferase
MMSLVRRATPADAPTLTRIVRESSAYVGEYRAIVENLEITSAQIERDTVYVCEDEGEISGFYSLIAKDGSAELDLLFVDNAFLGKGIGKMLFRHMVEEAERMGFLRVEIVAHPPAQAFYLKMGAVVVGEKPPSGRVTWTRPRMMLEVLST